MFKDNIEVTKHTWTNSSYCYSCKKNIKAQEKNGLHKCPDCNKTLWEELAMAHRKGK